jgi:putative FmdB family regulatory protein
MPIYEYRCASCGAELEKLQKISDPPLVECPECGKDALVKLVSASSFRLKGSGWYESDFKTGKKKNGVGDTDGSGSGTAPDSASGSAKAAATESTAESKSTSAESRKDAGKSSDSAAASSKPAPKE